MEKKNVVDGDISISGNIHISDRISDVFADGIENNVQISKTYYRQITKQRQFELPNFYIQRSLTHLKAIQETLKYYYPEKEFRPLRELLSEKQKMVLLGDAGMGKSTELRYLYNDLLISDEDVFPVWVSLNIHLLSESFEVYLPELANIDSAKIVLIMDGYDEIPSSDHPQLNRLIANLLLKRFNIKVLLSSRKNTYDISTKLEGFDVYYLNGVDLIDTERYFSDIGDALQYRDFEQELKRVNFLDIIKNPFYLNTIIYLYLSENALPDSRSKLMHHCIEKMITLDSKRSNTVETFDRFEVIKVIKKVALTMEMLCRNVISEADLRQILDKNEFDELKYFGGFKKENGTYESWKFDHNNFQEYLAASTISHLPFDQILKIISFEPDYTVLNPSWLNTISYLLAEIDSKDTFDKLLLWLTTHNSHFLVNAEPNRINKDIRFDVFKSIFYEFENDDTFLYSNHFTDNQLVAFVHDIDNVFIFLLEKYSLSNNIKVKTNALRLLGHIDYSKYYADFQTLYDTLFEGIKNHKILVNALLLHHKLDCLYQTNKLKDDKIEQIINNIFDVQSYEVIKSGVKIINHSEFADKYVSYLIKAFITEPTDNIFDVSFKFNLDIAFGNIKSKDGIINLLNQLNEVDWYYENKSSIDFFTKVMENVYNLYLKDDSILLDVIKTISNPELQESVFYQKPWLDFINKTGKRDFVFEQLLKAYNDKKIQNERILALLVTAQTIEHLLDDINSLHSKVNWFQLINVSANDNKDVIFHRIISSIEKSNNDTDNYFLNEFNFKQGSFNLLFDAYGFKKALKIFIDSYSKEKITKEDVTLLINKNHSIRQMFNTPDCIISLLQILTTNYKEISIAQFSEFINDEERIRNYRITKIRESIFYNDRLEIDAIQIEYLKYWTLDVLSRLEFKNLLPEIKYCIIDFSVRFDFDLPSEMLIQLLSFESYVKGKDTCFNWIKTKLDPKVLVTNITKLIHTAHTLSDRVLLNYFKYLNEIKVKDISHLILNAIKNTTFDQHHRICFIDEYLKSEGSLRQLKLVYDDNDNDIKWYLLEKLTENGESDFVLQILNKNISNIFLSPEDRSKTIVLLVKMEQDLGFLLYLSEVCDATVAIMDHRKVIKDIRRPQSISFLFALLELCLNYQKTLDTHRTISDITYVIENIAFYSNTNYTRIISEFENLKHIVPWEKPYLISMISGLKDRYYRSKADKRTLPEVKSMVKQIEAL